MRKTRTYNDEEKRQIIEEAKSSGNIASVARKNDVPVGTVHSWLEQANVKPSSKLKKNTNKELTIAKNKISDLELENKILKDLLKKTYQVWNND